MGKKVALVTGSHGFIGTHLCNRLMKEGYNVAQLPRDYLGAPEVLEEYLKQIQPTHIFHLASYGNMANQKDEDEIFGTNVVKTYLLLKASKDIKYDAFINFSTSAIQLPHQTLYSATKEAMEKICTAFVHEYKKPIVNVRPFSVYGPGEADFRFIPTVIDCLIRGRLLTLDHHAMHDWIYIDDFIDGVMLAIDNTDVLSGNFLEIGTGKQFSNIDVVTILEKIANKSLQIKEIGNLRSFDTASWRADRTIINLWGWRPKHRLKKGLQKTYEYYKNRIK